MKHMLYYTNKPVASIHKEPNTTSEMTTQAIYATPVTILEEKDGWNYVELPDAYQGWVLQQHIIECKKPYLQTAHTIQVSSLWSHICPVPDTEPHPPLLTLPFETKLELLSSPKKWEERWIEVTLLDGKTAWVQKVDYALNPEPIPLEEMLKLSKKFLGLPYLWGGKSSFGYDCSAFVQMLFRQMGLQLPRNSHQQANAPHAKPLSRGEIQEGDLLFFGRSPEKITHVGLSLGKGPFIHSFTTSTTKPAAIQISDLQDPDWDKLFVKACRFV